MIKETTESPIIGHLTLTFHEDGNTAYSPEVVGDNALSRLVEEYVCLCYMVIRAPMLAFHAFRCCEGKTDEEFNQLATDTMRSLSTRLKEIEKKLPSE